MTLKIKRRKKTAKPESASTSGVTRPDWPGHRWRWPLAVGVTVCLVSILIVVANWSRGRERLSEADLVWPAADQVKLGDERDEFPLPELAGSAVEPVGFTSEPAGAADGPRLLATPGLAPVELATPERQPSHRPSNDATPMAGLQLATHVGGAPTVGDAADSRSTERPAVWLLGYIEEVGD